MKAKKKGHGTQAKARPAPREVPLIGTQTIEFDDNRLAKVLFGEHDRHLARIESLMDVELAPRGNRLTIRGPSSARSLAERALKALYDDLAGGGLIDTGAIDAAVRIARSGADEVFEGRALRTPRRLIAPRSETQAHYLDAMSRNDLIFGLGPAGTGKTYLAVAAAVAEMTRGAVDRIVLSRPAVEAGERLGFLPGDMREKVDPYLRPLYDALHDMLPAELVQHKLEDGDIEVAPLAFMRGRTLTHCFVILDEAQNTTPMQMKMFLTRLGEGSRMVITGDPTQVDLPPGISSGLADARAVLRGVDGVAMIEFQESDVVRHPLVTRIVNAYNRRDASRGTSFGEHADDDQSGAPPPGPAPARPRRGTSRA